jgi:hypothetical protein
MESASMGATPPLQLLKKRVRSMELDASNAENYRSYIHKYVGQALKFREHCGLNFGENCRELSAFGLRSFNYGLSDGWAGRVPACPGTGQAPGAGIASARSL